MKKNLPKVLSVLVLTLVSFSCVDSVKIRRQGNQVITQGVFSAAGPFDKQGEDKIPFFLLGFHQPASGEKFPLLVILHGNGETPEHILEQWSGEAEKAGVMLLVPERLRPYQNEKRELRALNLLADKIALDHPVDSKRRYLAGTSSGALIARQMAVLQPSRWKGLILLASPPNEDWIEKTNPKSFPAVLFGHGMRDEQFGFERIRANAKRLEERQFRVAFLEDSEAGHEVCQEWMEPIFRWIKTGRLETQ